MKISIDYCQWWSKDVGKAGYRTNANSSIFIVFNKFIRKMADFPARADSIEILIYVT